MKPAIQILRRYKWYLIFFLIFIPIILFLITLSLQKKNTSTQPSQSGSESRLPTPTSLPTKFSILGKDPVNAATNVAAGDTVISFTTDTPLASQKAFTFTLTPPSRYGLHFLNSYPTTQVKVLPLGGLQAGTSYTATVHNQSGTTVASWSFTTSSTPPEAHSATRNQLDQDINAKYYPLTQYLPYSTSDFTVQEYSAHLTLKVLINIPDTDKAKKEVTDWIKSKGVDPATHTINYSNNF